MRKLLNIAGFLCFCLICYSGFANAKVRFITDSAGAETFKCSSKYIDCPNPKYGIGNPCGNLYLSCRCPAEYNTTCTSPKVAKTGAVSCDDKYLPEECLCPSQYQYTSSNCSGDYTPGGSTCDGKYDSCTCRYSKVTCSSNQTCSSYKCNDTVCTACKDNCTPSCTSVSSCSSGYTLTSMSDGCSGTCNVCKKDGVSCTQKCNDWNADGTFCITSGCGYFRGYGAYSTIIIPDEGLTVSAAQLTFWKSTTIQGGKLNVTDELFIGMDSPTGAGGLQTTHAIFENPVVVNGTIKLGRASTVKFNGGISGNYKCVHFREWTDYEEITCPF